MQISARSRNENRRIIFFRILKTASATQTESIGAGVRPTRNWFAEKRWKAVKSGGKLIGLELVFASHEVKVKTKAEAFSDVGAPNFKRSSFASRTLVESVTCGAFSLSLSFGHRPRAQWIRAKLKLELWLQGATGQFSRAAVAPLPWRINPISRLKAAAEGLVDRTLLKAKPNAPIILYMHIQFNFS